MQWRARGFQGLKVIALAHSEQGCALVGLCLSMCEVGVRAGGVRRPAGARSALHGVAS